MLDDKRLTARPGRSLDESVAEQMQDPEFRTAYLSDRLAVAIANQVTIGRARKDWGYSQLATASGLTEAAVHAIENGQHPLDLVTLRALSNALEITFMIDPDPS